MNKYLVLVLFITLHISQGVANCLHNSTIGYNLLKQGTLHDIYFWDNAGVLYVDVVFGNILSARHVPTGKRFSLFRGGVGSDCTVSFDGTDYDDQTGLDIAMTQYNGSSNTPQYYWFLSADANGYQITGGEVLNFFGIATKKRSIFTSYRLSFMATGILASHNPSPDFEFLIYLWGDQNLPDGPSTVRTMSFNLIGNNVDNYTMNIYPFILSSTTFDKLRWVCDSNTEVISMTNSTIIFLYTYYSATRVSMNYYGHQIPSLTNYLSNIYDYAGCRDMYGEKTWIITSGQVFSLLGSSAQTTLSDPAPTTISGVVTVINSTYAVFGVNGNVYSLSWGQNLLDLISIPQSDNVQKIVYWNGLIYYYYFNTIGVITVGDSMNISQMVTTDQPLTIELTTQELTTGEDTLTTMPFVTAVLTTRPLTTQSIATDGLTTIQENYYSTGQLSTGSTASVSTGSITSNKMTTGNSFITTSVLNPTALSTAVLTTTALTTAVLTTTALTTTPIDDPNTYKIVNKTVKVVFGGSAKGCALCGSLNYICSNGGDWINGQKEIPDPRENDDYSIISVQTNVIQYSICLISPSNFSINLYSQMIYGIHANGSYNCECSDANGAECGSFEESAGSSTNKVKDEKLPKPGKNLNLTILVPELGVSCVSYAELSFSMKVKVHPQNLARKKSNTPLIAGLVVGLSALAGAFVVVFILMKRKQKSNIDKLEENAQEMPLLVSFESIPLLSDITIDRKIGEGKFGPIFSGIWQGNRVYLKKLEYNQWANQFRTEAVNNFKLSHPSLLQFLGRYRDDSKFNYAVIQFIDLNTLRKYLDSNRDIPIAKKVKIMGEIAKGMNFINTNIHSHGNLSIDSVLITFVDEKINIKLSDFRKSNDNSKGDPKIFEETVDDDMRRFALVSLQILDFEKYRDFKTVKSSEVPKVADCPDSVWNAIIACMKADSDRENHNFTALVALLGNQYEELSKSSTGNKKIADPNVVIHFESEKGNLNTNYDSFQTQKTDYQYTENNNTGYHENTYTSLQGQRSDDTEDTQKANHNYASF